MNIHLVAIGTKMAPWVESGYAEYARRLPAECALRLHPLKLHHRGKGADIQRLLRREGEDILAATPKGARRVALEVKGKGYTTPQLAQRLEQWLQGGCDVALWVGGPDGIDPQVSRQADELWSLSPLTLPHPLVRVLVAEQLYRSWSLLQGHPYHR
ncbi:MAG: 23S rRNA (pseudouridine(1915)-N(3))-methyltransferase RlmH [Gammaproteobacteria bacterium]|nr:23S rRNA (pseudouridine(1915)-N(3))-methyltransferase RlmH [Gammaproteobacteria bacterium]